MHILLGLQTAFSLWMLYDAIKRGAPEYWWIIVLVPFGEFAEAGEAFRQVLAESPDDEGALYGYARCATEQGDTDAALLALEHLIDRRLDYMDHAACFDLANAYWNNDRKDDATALMERACKDSQRIGPRAAFAELLIQNGDTARATELLERGLRVYDSSPRHVKRRDRSFARKARTLLRGM